MQFASKSVAFFAHSGVSQIIGMRIERQWHHTGIKMEIRNVDNLRRFLLDVFGARSGSDLGLTDQLVKLPASVGGRGHTLRKSRKISYAGSRYRTQYSALVPSLEYKLKSLTWLS